MILAGPWILRREGTAALLDLPHCGLDRDCLRPGKISAEGSVRCRSLPLVVAPPAVLPKVKLLVLPGSHGGGHRGAGGLTPSKYTPSANVKERGCTSGGDNPSCMPRAKPLRNLWLVIVLHIQG